VYRGRLKTGEEVAVKVQRPGVLETVTVDLYIIRKLGLMLRNFPQVRLVWGCMFTCRGGSGRAQFLHMHGG
jgi:predicted unusual protein kinase regulating ubiquinone biosynthesis (AarF/ABC1/UbiB family)